MRVISYRHDGRPGVGVMVDDQGFVELGTAAPGLPDTLRAILEMEGDGLARVRDATDGKPAGLALADVELDPVIPQPHAIWALALNFDMHLAETRLTTSADFPQIFLRTPASQTGHGHALLCPDPKIAAPLDYEGELAVIIGKRGRHLKAAEVGPYIAGYSIYNEGSVRQFQQHNRQFGLGKNFEQSGSFGPWLMTPDEFGDPNDHTLITRLNGVEKQHSDLDAMVFSVGDVIQYLSTGYVIRPSDVIAMGTPGAIPPPDDWQPGPNDSTRVRGRTHMVPGDTVEIEISGRGTLVNPIAADGWTP